MKQKSLLTAYSTCQYISHQHVMHNAIPLFKLIAMCTMITATGNKAGNTKPMVEANYAQLCVCDFYCPVKREKQHCFAITIAPRLVLNQAAINYQFQSAASYLPTSSCIQFETCWSLLSSQIKSNLFIKCF